jgi:ornithine cyclodeaminase
MELIDRATVERIMTPAVALEAVRNGFLQLHRNEVEAPDEFVMHHPQQGDVHIKGAYLHDAPWMVAKVATAGFKIPCNSGAFVAMSAETGEIGYLVDDGGLLTELRTAAAVALTVDLLAREGAERLAIIGSGVQAGYQLDAVRSIRPFSEIGVYSRTAERAAAFADQHDLRAYGSAEEILQWADVILLATTSNEPIVKWLSQITPGTHITSSGADMVGKREVSVDVIQHADIVAVDSLVLAQRVGLLQPNGAATPQRSIVTVGELVAAEPTRRTDDLQITVAGLVGLGVQDAAIFGALLTNMS